ncbi:hypothetical protein ACFL2O_00560 [Thermodesulfobacteriota bacterium]
MIETTDSLSSEIYWLEKSFQFIRPDEFEPLGIDPADIPFGTFVALKHPSQLQSRFGGNAYGLGLYEAHDRLAPESIKLIQSIVFTDPESVSKHHKELNEIYRKIGLLVRFSNRGKSYYLIPAHLVSNTIVHIRSKVDEIAKIVGLHRKKYFKEHHIIGLVTHHDDLIIRELSLRFKEHNFVLLDSLKKLQEGNEEFDIVILTRDIYEISLLENFRLLSGDVMSKSHLDQFATYILWKIYNLLKPDGELFILGNYHTPKTNKTVRVTFKTEQEAKNFLLFSHIFKTRRKYKIKKRTVDANVFDFQKYLSGLYIEQETIDKLLGQRSLESFTLGEIDALPYVNYQIRDLHVFTDQEMTWDKLLSPFFNKIALSPMVPKAVKESWKKRFLCTDYKPRYMNTYLGVKKPVKTSRSEIMREVLESSLAGCSPELLAEYRDSFEYVVRTLEVIKGVKTGDYKAPPQIILDRLRQPLENRGRRFGSVNSVIKLLGKIGRINRISEFLVHDSKEGSRIGFLENLEILGFFGFTHDEIKELVFIVLGHTTMGRIISGKMNEKTLKPVSDLARTYDLRQSINLLRYCRLMTMAEMEAARATSLTQEHFANLFDLYELMVRIVTNRNLDWERLLDERITSVGGIHNQVILKILKMMNHFEFLENWSELGGKGQMEKEALADYDEIRLSRIKNVLNLINIIEQFEEMFLESDPLRLPAFYRKLLDIEFHGTGHIFERMNSEHIFILLWITVNLARGEVVNFNPILSDLDPEIADTRIRKAERDVGVINIRYLGHDILEQFSEQLYTHGSSYIVGTGFQLRTDPETKALEIAYMDIDKDIDQLDKLSRELAGLRISQITIENIMKLESLFSNLESFYQSHLRLLQKETGYPFKLPRRQKQWFEKVRNLRDYLSSEYLHVIYHPEEIHTDLELLSQKAPTFLSFILPELMALKDLTLPAHLYMTSSVLHYIITACRKLQALVLHDKAEFQDVQFLHSLAQREFGPMTAGTVGPSESQIEALEKIIENISNNAPLFKALVKSLIFQDLGRVASLREKYKSDISKIDIGFAGALFLEREEIPERYGLDEKEKGYLIFLVRHHSYLHHIVRGELPISSLKDILAPGDKDLFDAFFVFSFIMLSAIRKDLILEDLAGFLFQIRELSHRIIDGETTLENWLDEIFSRRGSMFFALQSYQEEGLPEGVVFSAYLGLEIWKKFDRAKRVVAGKMIFGVERLFRLRGIRNVDFVDLVNLMIKAPLEYVYKQRRFSSIGYASFEREIYEAFRIYNTLQNLKEEIRHFILEWLVHDRVRIFGYEKVSGFLNYNNQIKLLLIGLQAIGKCKPGRDTARLDFLSMSDTIEKRYEAANDYLNMISNEKVWKDKKFTKQLLSAKTGLILKKDKSRGILSIDFQDRINISQKVSHMVTINNVEQLKNYFHHSLKSLRKHQFSTDDYELELEDAFESRLRDITEGILTQTKKQMDLIEDFEELHGLVNDLMERSLEIGFSVDQKHRLNDLYELRKDKLKGKKLEEISKTLEMIQDIDELDDYWGSIKWYLQGNRQFLGKEFENLIARRFDETALVLASGE